MLRHSSYLGKTLLNRYEIRSMLGEGGMGQVFLAWDLQAREHRAIKLIDVRKKKYPLETVLRFKAEAENLKSLRHPSIVKYIDFTNEDDIYMLIMEYIESQSLSKYWDDCGPMTIESVLELFKTLAEALLYVHEKDLVHHDLKASNLLIDVQSPGNLKIKLLDFGLSKLVNATGQSTGGTLAYMAPEQTGILHKIVDHRADLYSLGIMIYEALVSHVPFRSSDPALLIHQHVAQQPEPPSQFRSDIPTVLENIVLKLLSKDPDDRYRTTRGLLKDLEKYIRLSDNGKKPEITFDLGEEDHWDSLPQETPFVGRKKELREALQLLEKVSSQGTGEMLMIEGSGGLGKTRILSELFNETRSRQKVSWMVNTKKEETDIPFKFFKTVLSNFVFHLKNLPEAEQFTTLQYWLKTLGHRFSLFLELVPELSAWMEGSFMENQPASPEAWKTEDYQEVIFEFANAITQTLKPLIIFIDDLQNLDSTSFDTLFAGLEHFQKKPIYWLVSCNFDELSKDCQKKVLEHSKKGFLKRTHLGPLSEASYGNLLQQLFSNKLHGITNLLEPLHTHTQGNPYQLRQLLQHLIDRKGIFYSNGSWRFDLELVQQLSEEYDQQSECTVLMGKLSQEQQSILQRGAVFQRAFLLEAIERTLKAPPPIEDVDTEKLLKTLDYGLQHGILSVDSKRLYSFRDKTLHRTLLNRLSKEVRQSIHREIALFLEEVILPNFPESIYDIAHHWGKSGDDKTAMDYYIKAAKKTDDGVYQNEQAQFYYNLAVKSLKKIPPGRVDASFQFDLLYKAINHNLTFTRDYDALWDDAMALEPLVQGDRVLQMKFLGVKSVMSFMCGRKADMFRFGEELIQIATEPDDERYLTLVYNLMGRVASERSYDERIELLTKGIDLALRYDLLDQIPGSMMVRTTLYAYQTRFREAEQEIHRLTQIWKERGFPMPDMLESYALTLMETERGEFLRILGFSEHLFKTEKKLFGAIGKAMVTIHSAHAYGMTGNTTESLQLFESILQKNEKQSQQFERAPALLGRIQVALHSMDDPETALHYLEEAQTQMSLRPDPYMQAMYGIHSGWAYLKLNQNSLAAQHLEEAQQFALPLKSPLLNAHLNFALTKLRWHQTQDSSCIEEANQILIGMLEREITGFYELYKDELKTWSIAASDSSSQLSSYLQGNAEILKLMEINRKISSTLDLRSLFQTVIEGAMQIVGAEQGYLYVRTNDFPEEYHEVQYGEFKYMRMARNSKGETIEEGDHSVSKTIIEKAVELKTAIVTRDARSESQWKDSDSIQLHKLRSVMATPILLKGELKGILYLDNHHATSVFSLKDKEIVEIFATQVSIAVNNAQIYLKEQEARKKTESTMQVFERFVPQQFTNRFAEGNIESLSIGLAKQETLTVLFSDLRSFTSLTEDMPPDEVFAFLNEYLHRMESPIRKHNGFVDKFIGDAIMALFDQSPIDAVYAGLEMQYALQIYNMDRMKDGKPALKIGIGINTGEVTIGVIGSQERMDTTVLGDTVNTASRIESLTKYYQCAFLVGDETVTHIKDRDDLLIRLIDQVQVKGKQAPTSIYEIYNYNPDPVRFAKREHQELFQQAFHMYQAGQWVGAQSTFEEYSRRFPEDPLAQVFIERCKLYIKVPPENWNGIFKIENK